MHSKFLFSAAFVLTLGYTTVTSADVQPWSFTSITSNSHYDVHAAFLIEGTTDIGLDYEVSIYDPSGARVYSRYFGRADNDGSFSFSIIPAAHGCYGSSEQFTVHLLFFVDGEPPLESSGAFRFIYFDDNSGT